MPIGIKGFQIGNDINKGKIPKTAFKKGNQYGKLNKGTKRTMSSWNKGLKGWTKGTKAGFQKGNKSGVGDKNGSWKGGISNRKQEAKIRDDYICQVCGLREPEIMEVDHILPKSRIVDKKFELENLITLCPNCHRRKTNRDKKQYNLYRNSSNK